MLKYVLTAAALQLFSTCELTRNIYRRIGNTIGARKRLQSKVPDYYFERISRTLRLSEDYGILRDGYKIIEIGSGWIHWEALTARLFYDIEATLYDVWDNRQFIALKKYIEELGLWIENNNDIGDARKTRAKRIIKIIKSSQSFDELYEALGFSFIIHADGSMNKIADNSYDYLVSAGVLEHLDKRDLKTSLAEFHRIMKPGAYSFHSINISDHLQAYDRKEHIKNYMKYSDSTWKLCFENKVQYFNRVQRQEWKELFEGAGYLLIREETSHCNDMNMRICKKYEGLANTDLSCISQNILHRKQSHA